MRILIIEDEQLTADDLVHCIKSVRPHFEVLAIKTSVKSAISYLKTAPSLDLIFSDIQLTDGLSFEIFKTIPIDTPVIFCTAYDEYALNAFDANGIAYVLKPFTSDTIETAIGKFEKLTDSKDAKLTQLIQFMEQSQLRTSISSILVHEGEKIIPISFDNIALFYLKNSVVQLYTFNHQSFIVSESLEELELGQSNQFFRANRQCLINRKAVKNAARYFNRRLVLHLNIVFDDQIIVSREKASDFLEWLRQS